MTVIQLIYLEDVYLSFDSALNSRSKPKISDSSGGTLIDLIVEALHQFLISILSPVRDPIEKFGNRLIQTIISTPNPNVLFSRPTNPPWTQIYDYYWDLILPLAIGIFALVIGLVIILESTSHLFSSYHTSLLKSRAFSGLIGILSWWWLAGLSLRITNQIGELLVPSMKDLTLFELASLSGVGILISAFAFITEFILFFLIGLMYLSRHILLYLFVLLMPILIAFWIPGVGPFKPMSRFMEKLAGFYVPFLFMTIPVALLLRLGELLGHSFGLSFGGIGAWITALVIPILAVFAPIVMFWQAGGIFRLAGQTARHVSHECSQRRIQAGQNARSTTVNIRDNFLRGTRGQLPVSATGETRLDLSTSRAHSAGTRVRNASLRLSGILPSTNRTGRISEHPTTGSDPGRKRSRATDFELLRDDRPRPMNSRARDRATKSTSEEDIPPYIQ